MNIKILILSLSTTCLIQASEKSASPISPKLLPDAHITYAEIYPLHAAAITNNVSDIYTLVNDDAIPTEQSDHVGYTPLHYAASQGHIEAANVLLALGAEVHVKANCGQTPIKLARQNGHKSLEEFLTLYQFAKIHKEHLPRISPISVPDKK